MFKEEENKSGVLGREHFLYQQLTSKGLQSTFPNVEVFLGIYLILMVANCSGERPFSKMKLIKSRLRTTMTQERLSSLALLSIESDLLRKLDFADIINDFARCKARKVSLL